MFFHPTTGEHSFMKVHQGLVSIDAGTTYLEKGILRLKYNLAPPALLKTLLCGLQDQMMNTGVLLGNENFNSTDKRIKEMLPQRLDRVARKLVSIMNSNYFISSDLKCRLKKPKFRLHPITNRLDMRAKRGLINIGGDLLKFVFGVAVEDDITKFEDQTKVLQQKVSLVLERAQHNILVLNKNFEDLKHAHNVLDEELFVLNVESFINFANSVLEEAKTSLLLVDTVITSAIQNVVHPTIIPFNEFLAIIKEGTRTLRLSPVLNPNFENYYRYLSLCGVDYLGSNYSLIVNIPFTNDIKYETKLVQPFPNIRNNQTYLEVDLEPIIFGRSSNNYFEIDMLSFGKCKRADNITLCNIRQVRTLENNCLVTILDSNDTSKCNFIEISSIKISNKPRIVELEGNILINFGNLETKVNIHCPSGRTTIVAPDIILIPNKCSLFSSKITIHSHVIKTLSKILKIPILSQYIDLSTIETPNPIVSLSPTHPLKGYGNDISGSWNIQHHAVHYGLFTFVLILIISLLGIGVWWKLRFEKTQSTRFRLVDFKQVEDEPQSPPPSRAGTPFPRSPRVPRTIPSNTQTLESRIVEEDPLGV